MENKLASPLVMTWPRHLTVYLFKW